jgi:hypothetical protein
LAGWDDFAIVIGGAAGALTGLFFVAVSIRVEVIARSSELRNRAAQTLGLFLVVLLTSVLLVVPGQFRPVLGIELLLLGLTAGVTAVVLDRHAKRQRDTRRIAKILENATPNAVTAGLTGGAGIILVIGPQAGLYLLVPAAIAALTGGVVNAWLFLTYLAE